MERFRDKVALITGASSGIGRALAEALLREGAYCAVASRDIEGLRNLSRTWQEDFKIAQERILPLRLDVSQRDHCRDCLEALRNKWGRLDILINNAGHGVSGPAIETPTEEIRSLFDVHYLGPFWLIQDALDMLKANAGSHVVMISSIAAFVSPPSIVHYAAAKAAMNALARGLRVELGGHGIGFLCVMPGVTQTDFGKKMRRVGEIVWPRISSLAEGQTPQAVACVTLNALTKDKTEVVAGIRNRMLVAGYRIFSPLWDRWAPYVFGEWSGDDWDRSRES